MTLLGHALAARSRGFHIFPCNAAGAVCPETGQNIEKVGHLVEPGKPYKIRWSEVATTDVDQIIRWWNADPWANIGIAAKQSQLLIVDCDMPKDGGEEGIDQWAALCVKKMGGSNAWKMFDTYAVRTGSGGTHFYYWWPVGVQASQRGLAPLVDIRSNGGDRGGYVLGEGSITSKGKYTIDLDIPVLSAPRWLVAACTEPPKQPEPPRGPFDQPRKTGDTSGLEDAVRLAVESNRNATLHWAACAMAVDGHPLHLALERLGAATSLGDKEASDTIKSAYRMKGAK